MQGVEGIKLIRNSKGYNWEIKTKDLDIEKIKLLNEKMKELYGKEGVIINDTE